MIIKKKHKTYSCTPKHRKMKNKTEKVIKGNAETNTFINIFIFLYERG